MYQVWTKNEFGEEWTLKECTSTEDVKSAVLGATRMGREALVSRPVEVSIDVRLREELPKVPDKPGSKPAKKQDKTEEVTEHEVTESGSAKDPGTRGKGNSSV